MYRHSSVSVKTLESAQLMPSQGTITSCFTERLLYWDDYVCIGRRVSTSNASAAKLAKLVGVATAYVI